MELLEILSQMGPSLSSELIEELIKTGIKRNTARQRISRAFRRKFIKRTSVTFGKGQHVYFLPEEKESEVHKKILQAVKRRRRLNRLYEELRARHVIPYWHAAKTSGVYGDVPKDRKADSLDKLISDLQELGIGRLVDFKHQSGKHVFLVLSRKYNERAKAEFEEIVEKMAEEEKATEDMISLLESSGLGKGFSMRPTSLSVPADALGDCKPYLRAGQEVHSKIMVEVNMLWKLSKRDLDGLLDRVHVLRKELDVYSIIVYIVADLQKSAFDYANKIGWKSIRPRRVRKIKQIENMRRKGVLLFQEVSPKKYDNIIREIRNFDDLKQLGDYKSLWFETVVRDFFDGLGYHTRGRKRYYLDNQNRLTEKWTKRTAFEIDVFGRKSNEVIELVICECKNWLEVVSKNEIRKFVRKLNILDTYYNKGGNKKVKIHGFFIASELPDRFERNTRTKLTVTNTEGFRKFAKKALAKHQEESENP